MDILSEGKKELGNYELEIPSARVYTKGDALYDILPVDIIMMIVGSSTGDLENWNMVCYYENGTGKWNWRMYDNNLG